MMAFLGRGFQIPEYKEIICWTKINKDPEITNHLNSNINIKAHEQYLIGPIILEDTNTILTEITFEKIENFYHKYKILTTVYDDNEEAYDSFNIICYNNSYNNDVFIDLDNCNCLSLRKFLSTSNVMNNIKKYIKKFK